MNKKENIKFFVKVLIPVILIAALIIALLNLITNPHTKEKDKVYEYGIIESVEPEDPERYYIPQGDEMVEPEPYVYITNLNLVYELLPLERISSLGTELASYTTLNKIDGTEAMIERSSILADKTYPSFKIVMENDNKTKIHISYDVVNDSFTFQ